jgi:hypothetical protein
VNIPNGSSQWIFLFVSKQKIYKTPFFPFFFLSLVELKDKGKHIDAGGL